MGLLDAKWNIFKKSGDSSTDKYGQYSLKGPNKGKLYLQSTTSVDNINSSMTDYPEFSSAEGLKDIFNDLNTAPGTQEVQFAWQLIEEWIASNQSEVEINLSDGCLESDLKTAQTYLRTRLPKCVIQSLLLHDGQLNEQPAKHGLLFGLQLMSLDEIVEMTDAWRKVYEKEQTSHLKHNELLTHHDDHDDDTHNLNKDDLKDIEQTQKENINKYPELMHLENMQLRRSRFKMNDIPKQSSIPPHFIQECYTHPAWIPLVTDYSGNHIGIDLSPAPEGLVGQVILFGREFDTKYAVAPNWGDFMLIFAKDLEEGHYSIKRGDSLTGEADLVYIDEVTGREVGYFEVLKQRVINEYAKVLKQQEIDELNQPKQDEQDSLKDQDSSTSEVNLEDGN